MDSVWAQHRQEDLQRGERRGKAIILLEQLQHRFGIIEPELHARIMSADDAALSRWARELINAPDLESTFN